MPGMDGAIGPPGLTGSPVTITPHYKSMNLSEIILICKKQKIIFDACS